MPWVSPSADGSGAAPKPPAAARARTTKFPLQLPVALAAFFGKGLQRAQFIEKTSRQGSGRFASELSCAQTVDILRCMIAENS